MIRNREKRDLRFSTAVIKSSERTRVFIPHSRCFPYAQAPFHGCYARFIFLQSLTSAFLKEASYTDGGASRLRSALDQVDLEEKHDSELT